MRTKTKRVTLNPRSKSHVRKLGRLLADGWVIVSEHKRGLLSFSPGFVDYVLRPPPSWWGPRSCSGVRLGEGGVWGGGGYAALGAGEDRGDADL